MTASDLVSECNSELWRDYKAGVYRVPFIFVVFGNLKTHVFLYTLGFPSMLPFDGGLNQKQYRVVKNLGIAAGSGEVSEAFAAEVQGLMGVPPLKSEAERKSMWDGMVGANAGAGVWWAAPKDEGTRALGEDVYTYRDASKEGVPADVFDWGFRNFLSFLWVRQLKRIANSSPADAAAAVQEEEGTKLVVSFKVLVLRSTLGGCRYLQVAVDMGALSTPSPEREAVEI